jgi:hypothetical protein
MLVHILYGKSKSDASSKGSMHFGEMPRQGDLVEVDGVLCTVLMSWHTPAKVFAGTKASILVHETVPALGSDLMRVKDGVDA